MKDDESIQMGRIYKGSGAKTLQSYTYQNRFVDRRTIYRYSSFNEHVFAWIFEALNYMRYSITDSITDSATDIISYIIGWVITAWLGWHFGGGLGQFFFLFLLIHAGRETDEIIAIRIMASHYSITVTIGIIMGLVIALAIKYTMLLTHPGFILAFISYLVGVYVSMIKYPIDLYLDSDNMKMLNGVSILSYIVASVIFPFIIR